MTEQTSKEFGVVDNAYSLDLETVVTNLDSNKSKGLKQSEVEKRLARVGENRIITPSPSVWEIYLAPMLDTLITVYLIITGIMILLAFVVDEIVSKIAFWLVMISFNFIMAIFQQYRAQKKVEALSSLSPPMAKVVRDGGVKEIEAKNLVPGDLIELSLGDRIPADARLIESSNLTVNEASLTGESVAVRKASTAKAALPPETPIAKHDNMVYLGTFVQTGNGRAIIVKTGNDTELGQIATEMSAMSGIEIPLRNKVNQLGKGLSILMVTFLVTLVITTGIRRISSGDGLTLERFAFDLSQAIITAMSVLPINIPLLTTVVLITGVLNMAKKKVVIKELSAVETLGRCSVLCSDKTGTITTGKMTVKLLWDTKDFFQVWPEEDFTNKIIKIPSENILQNMDHIPEDHKPIINIRTDSALELLISGAVLNNDADITPVESDEGTEYKIIGNFTDGALLVLAMTNGLDTTYIRTRYKQTATYPFDSSIKRMSGLFEDTKEGDVMIFSKGASEVILPRCSRIGDESNIQELTEEQRQEILDEVAEFANQGYRVISMAYKPADEFHRTPDDEAAEREKAESDLIYIGFAVIYDPPRPRVYDAVADLDSAGIFPIMITGDAKTTAGTIARQVGILDGDEIVVEGSEASKLPDEEFFKVSVFARVAPKDKEVIVNRYQKRGDVVAMTGDGVNDSLAITRSDAGVAMGISGTEVAKEAADIILTDDSYVSLVEGVREGRNLYNKIRIMIFFYIAVNLAEALMYFTTSFRLDFYLLNDWQRAYIFGIVHAIPVLAIIFGPDDQKVMQLKPRQNDALLTRNLIYLVAMFAISSGLLFIISYFIYYNSPQFVNKVNRGGISQYLQFVGNTNNLSDLVRPEDLAQAKARTILLTIIYLIESIFVLSIIRVNRPIWETVKDVNGFVYAMVTTPLILHFSLMYITPLQLLLHKSGIGFELIPLSLLDLLFVFFIVSIPLAILEGYKYYVREIEEKQF